MEAIVTSVSRDRRHGFSKVPTDRITLVAGIGVEDDAHAGETVKHRSRVAKDPTAPNLRQVHLIHSELHDELRQKGFEVGAADLGENITTWGIDLLALPRGTLLRIGAEAVIEVTGLRNPCAQIDRFRKGLLKAVLVKSAKGKMEKKAGIMGIVKQGGVVATNDRIVVELPETEHIPLEGV